MLEPAAPGSTLPRAFLRIGGMTVARQQLGLMLALQCERIVCLAHGISPDLIELQHAAEAAGAQFNVIAGPRQLLGLVTTSDEVFVLGDGLFASTAEAAATLEQGQAVLVQPIEQGLAAGFERIDLNHASAAAMRIPGRLVEQIAELPADCDAASALQRIALQGGVRQRPIPATSAGTLFWTLVRSEEEAHALEPQWIRQRTRGDEPLNPSRGFGLLAVRLLGPALLHAGSGAGVVAIASGAMGAIALGTGWLGLPALGLGLAAISWLLCETTASLARIEGDPGRPARMVGGRRAYGWLLDAIIIGLAGSAMPVTPGDHLLTRFFAPFMLVGVLRLVPRALSGRWTAWLMDRSLLAILLAGFIGAGRGEAAISIAAALVVLAGIVLPRGELVLTRP